MHTRCAATECLKPSPPGSGWRRDRGFTLIELLVSLSILLILSLIGIALVNSMEKSDRISGAARNTQSFLEGARDRARHDELPRGVRFFSHPNNGDVINRMVYIGPAGILSEGTVQVDSNGRTVRPSNPGLWNRLRNRGLLIDGARITIEDNFYTIVWNGTNWRLTKDFDFNGPVNTDFDYQLDLAPAILPNQEPRQLPDGVVIDVDHSRLPRPRTLPDGTRTWDVMFSPRGTVVGPAAVQGHVHLLFRSLADFEERHDTLGNENNESPELIVTITTRTGSVSTHSPGPGGDTFRNAETGVESE